MSSFVFTPVTQYGVIFKDQRFSKYLYVPTTDVSTAEWILFKIFLRLSELREKHPINATRSLIRLQLGAKCQRFALKPADTAIVIVVVLAIVALYGVLHTHNMLGVFHFPLVTSTTMLPCTCYV
ncbi:hypothetical protein GQX74_012921 [Glossina fuscipes]|nr:hypothetical protein GQX74_012921 [Glossina fuscipes]